MKHRLTGTIVSNRMAKTVVVKVEGLKIFPKYRARFKVFKKYKAHVEKGDYQPGDKVVIEETRPMSKDKRWRVIKKII